MLSGAVVITRSLRSSLNCCCSNTIPVPCYVTFLTRVEFILLFIAPMCNDLRGRMDPNSSMINSLHDIVRYLLLSGLQVKVKKVQMQSIDKRESLKLFFIRTLIIITKYSSCASRLKRFMRLLLTAASASEVNEIRRCMCESGKHAAEWFRYHKLMFGLEPCLYESCEIIKPIDRICDVELPFICSIWLALL